MASEPFAVADEFVLVESTNWQLSTLETEKKIRQSIENKALGTFVEILNSGVNVNITFS